MRSTRLTILGLLSFLACGTEGEISSELLPLEPAPPTGSDPNFVGDGTFDDFPAAPILDGAGVPPDAASLFGPPGGPGGSGGPCLLEPPPGALLPRDGLRPRFEHVPPAGQNLFEIRLHADKERHDLVVYTAQRTWTLPQDLWQKISLHLADQTLTVQIRGASFDGKRLTSAPATGAGGTFTVAPVSAPGTLVYWTTTPDTTFQALVPGAEKPQEILNPTKTGSACVGCHTSTPDGSFVGYTRSDANGRDETMRIDLRSADGTASRPGYLTPTALSLLGRVNQEQPTFSGGHWSPGDRVLLSLLLVNNRSEIAWTDLEASSAAEGTGWGIVKRTGDSAQAASAVFSHDGTRIAYCSSPNRVISGVQSFPCDIYLVPFGARTGGNATPLHGASDEAFNEFYPAFSADDAWVAFSRTTADQDSYDNPLAEVFVVPSAGGDPHRLEANDPAACSGRKSPGVTNSWPRWSPEATTSGGRTFYWLTFSSKRAAGERPQLYIAGLVVQGGVPTSYPAVRVWSQTSTQNNHTPSWDTLRVDVR